MEVQKVLAGKKLMVLAAAVILIAAVLVLLPSLMVDQSKVQRQMSCLSDRDLAACVDSCAQDRLYEACQIACDEGDAGSCSMKETCDTSPDVVCYMYAEWE